MRLGWAQVEATEIEVDVYRFERELALAKAAFELNRSQFGMQIIATAGLQRGRRWVLFFPALVCSQLGAPSCQLHACSGRREAANERPQADLRAYGRVSTISTG